jgi:hypothetical protein
VSENTDDALNFHIYFHETVDHTDIKNLLKIMDNKLMSSMGDYIIFVDYDFIDHEDDNYLYSLYLLFNKSLRDSTYADDVIIPENIINESYIDSSGNLVDFDFNVEDDVEEKPRLFYPYKQLQVYVHDFRNKHVQEMNDYGFDIFVSDSEIPNEKYDLALDQDYYQVQKLDTSDMNLSDQDIIESAKGMGIIVDEYGVVQGFGTTNLVSRYNKQTWD